MTTSITSAVLEASSLQTDSTFALAPIVLLIALIILRGVASGIRSERSKLIQESANVAIVPLAIVFIVTVVSGFVRMLAP